LPLNRFKNSDAFPLPIIFTMYTVILVFNGHHWHKGKENTPQVFIRYSSPIHHKNKAKIAISS